MREEKDGLISIIVPVYNTESYIERCIDSILAQTYKNIEIIIIDDGSTDSSGKIAENYRMKYSDKVVVIHQENRGLSAARNTGLEYAHGNYVTFVDSDDFVAPEMYDVMIKKMKEESAEIASCGRNDIYPDRSVQHFLLDDEIAMNSEEAIRRILIWDGLDISACDKVFLQSLWENIRFPEGRNNEDICTIPYIIKKAQKILHVPYAFYFYCHRKGSITTVYNEKKIKDFYYAFHQFRDFCKKHYPMIRGELVFYLNHSYLSLLMMTEIAHYKGEEKKEAVMYLNENWKNTFSLNHMSKKEKVIFILLKIHIFNTAIWIKRRIERLK